MNSKDKWFYSDGSNVFGPYPREAISQLVAAGNIAEDFYVAPQGAKNWQPVHEVFPRAGTGPARGVGSGIDGPSSGSAQAPRKRRGVAPVIGGAEASAQLPPPPGLISTLSGQVTSVAGVERIEGFSLKKLFSEVFTNHSLADVDNEFSVGSELSTPPLGDVDTSWPRPWIFFRAFALSLVIYFPLVKAFEKFQNPKLIPAIITIGSFAIPLSVMILFFEANVRKNVSLSRVIFLFMTGGIAAIVLTHAIGLVTQDVAGQWMGASIAALSEEPAKLIAVVLFCRSARFHYIHNGLLFGAAVGAGFAAFESAGYAFQVLMDTIFGTLSGNQNLDPIQEMLSNITLRGVLSPLGHIVWTAIAAAALWKAKGTAEFSVHHLFKGEFLRVFAISVLLHMAWNSHFQLPFFGKYIVLGFVGWVIAVGFIQSGLKEVNAEMARSV